jgi:hypothetical protein
VSAVSSWHRHDVSILPTYRVLDPVVLVAEGQARTAGCRVSDIVPLHGPDDLGAAAIPSIF